MSKNVPPYERKKTLILSVRRTHEQYYVFSCQYPGFSPRRSLSAQLVRGSDADSSPSPTPEGACNHRRAGALCPSPVRAVCSDRFCCGAPGLRDQRRTHAGSLLRGNSALGERVYGTFWTRSLASARDALG